MKLTYKIELLTPHPSGGEYITISSISLLGALRQLLKRWPGVVVFKAQLINTK